VEDGLRDERAGQASTWGVSKGRGDLYIAKKQTDVACLFTGILSVRVIDAVKRNQPEINSQGKRASKRPVKKKKAAIKSERSHSV